MWTLGAFYLPIFQESSPPATAVTTLRLFLFCHAHSTCSKVAKMSLFSCIFFYWLDWIQIYTKNALRCYFCVLPIQLIETLLLEVVKKWIMSFYWFIHFIFCREICSFRFKLHKIQALIMINSNKLNTSQGMEREKNDLNLVL